MTVAINETEFREFAAEMRLAQNRELEALTRLEERGIKHDQDLADHERTLYGNGQPGLKTLVEGLLANDRRRTWLERVFIGAAIVQFVAAVAIVSVWVIRKMGP